jgi:outer membrane protein OmpA-like peptidoglycan-associated protein
LTRLFLFVLFVVHCASAQQHSIYFDSGSHTLNEAQQSELISLFSSEDKTFNTIVISGYCDDVGSSESNSILSQKRAESVTRFLQNELQITVESSQGKGEIETTSSVENKVEFRRKNRVVTIDFHTNILTPKTTQTKEPSTTSDYKTFSDDLQKGDKVIMKNLLFMGSLTVFEFPEEAEIELKKIVTFLKDNPSAHIEIQGHVCCITNSFKDAFDRNSRKNNLSETRAKKIFDYLVDQDIPAERLTYKGYGRKFPIPGGIESENRRVEILITKI